MTAIDDLIERVESGKGEDRGLNGDIAEMFNPDMFVPDLIRGQARPYTTSIDAVASLIERKLAGWLWASGNDENGPFATVQRWTGAPLFDAVAKSPARALLAATLRAIKEHSHDR